MNRKNCSRQCKGPRTLLTEFRLRCLTLLINGIYMDAYNSMEQCKTKTKNKVISVSKRGWIWGMIHIDI